MQNDWYKSLTEDVRFIESVNACMNCGICTAICPAAEFFEYDPRSIITIVQSGNKERILELINSETIWLCGQCMSCKTRCPRGNTPGVVISVLRKIAQETGTFVNNRRGRQQYLIRKVIGSNILNYGYCIHPTSVVPETHPEQGPVWKWIFENRRSVYERVGANLDKDGAGALRKISQESLQELKVIFEETGAFELWDSIDSNSEKKAVELGFVSSSNKPDMDAYTHFIANE